MTIQVSKNRTKSAFILIIILVLLGLAAVAGVGWAVYKVRKAIRHIDNQVKNQQTNDQIEAHFQLPPISQLSGLDIPPGWQVVDMQVLDDDLIANPLAAPLPLPQWETSTNLIDWEPSDYPVLSGTEPMRFYRAVSRGTSKP